VVIGESAMGEASRRALDEAVRELRMLEQRVGPDPGQLIVRQEASCTALLLDDPGSKNALSVSMMRQLAEAARRLADAPSGLVVLAAATAGVFCAGGNLRQVREVLMERRWAEVMSRSMTSLTKYISDAPSVWVAVVEGPVVGGGVELAACCDLVVATSEARFDAAQGRLGVVAGWGGMLSMRRRMGPQASFRVFARAESLSAERALALGLVDCIVDGDRESMVRAMISSGAPIQAMIAAKRQARSDDPREQVEAFLSVWGGAYHRQSMGVES
jgi:enoyl-CoA hydratase/carnithine racemase